MGNAAQEYCLVGIQHWSMCMTKGEWSGWVQAFGAVTAIFFAYILANWQHKKQTYEARRLEANLRQLNDLLKTEVTSHFFDEAHAVCEALGHAKDLAPRHPIYTALERSEELEQIFKDLPPYDLPGHGVAFGVLKVPQVLRNLRESAKACVDARAHSSSIGQVIQLPSRVEMFFDIHHKEATAFILGARLTCAAQIKELKELTAAT